MMDRGDLVSDELIINLIMSNMSRPSCINGGFFVCVNRTGAWGIWRLERFWG